MEWYLCVIASLAAIVMYQMWTRRSLPPGPWGVPFFGYLFWIDPKAPYRTLAKLADEYGSVYGLWMGSVYTIVLTDVWMIKNLFSSDATTGRAPLFLTHGIMKGFGLICAEGELWKEHRKFATKSLKQLGATKTNLNKSRMEHLLMEHVNGLLMFFTKNTGMGIDPSNHIRYHVGSIMNSIVFGKSWEKDDKEWNWLQESQEEGAKQIGVAGPMNFLPFLRFIPRYQQMLDFLVKGKEETHEVYRRIIAEQSEQLKHHDIDFEADVDNILQAFLLEKERKSESEASKLYNDQQFVHLLADLFGAGMDTTVTTLRWYFLYMAKNPNIQRTVRTEINHLTQGRPPNLEDMGRIPLYEASMLETQRIRSVVPIGVPHGALKELEVAGYRIPKGTMIVPLQWGIHMDGKVWKDPDVFNPWRFIDEEGMFVKSSNVIPFQCGKRVCIGYDLAHMMLFLFATTVIQNFTLSLENENVDFAGDCGIILTPKPYKLIFTKTNIVES